MTQPVFCSGPGPRPSARVGAAQTLPWGLRQRRKAARRPRAGGAGGQRQATHQVDAVGVHPAQGPPALVRVVVLGVGLHAAGVVAGGAAAEENTGSEGPPAWLEAHSTSRCSSLATTEPPLPLSGFWLDNCTVPGPHLPVFREGTIACSCHTFTGPWGAPCHLPKGAGQGTAAWTVSLKDGVLSSCGRAERTSGTRIPRCRRVPSVPCFRPGNSALTARGRPGGHSPGHLHEGEGHGRGVDGQVPVQVDDDAEVEQVDPHCKERSRRSGRHPEASAFFREDPLSTPATPPGAPGCVFYPKRMRKRPHSPISCSGHIAMLAGDTFARDLHLRGR